MHNNNNNNNSTKRIILIIDDKRNISEALLSAYEAKAVSGLDFFIAKTSQAADKLLSDNPNIAAVVSPSKHSTGLDLSLLNSSKAKAKDKAKGKAKGKAKNKIISDLSASELLIALEAKGIFIQKRLNACDTQISESIASLREKVLSLEINFNYLSKSVENAILESKALRSVIDNCPIKQAVLNQGLANKQKPTDEAANGSSGKKATITVAIVSLIGVIFTAVSGILSKAIEIIVGYYYK